MAEYTPNFNLSMPEQTDTQASFIADYRANMGIIDDNLGGGGGGAEIIEMTQAEYDALPDTKLTDGVLRAIKDEYSPADSKLVGLGECYSTSEREVGCWTDGKPLYQKTLIFSNPTLGRVDNLPHNIADVDTIILDFWEYRQSSGTAIVGFEDTNLSWWGNFFVVDRTGLSYRIGANWGSGGDLIVNVKYTKTTDVAGSGTWTPEGVPAHHYSTTEQVVGTYFGKTLYEKGFNVGTQSFSSGQMAIANDLSNVDEVVEYGGSAKEPRDNRNIPLPYMRKAWDECVNLQVMQLPGGTLSIAIVTNDSWYTSLENIKIWVRYTKSV